ncbi:GL21073 [Drosophila persimilis]|uniref:GL21073 n=1 Tax=Drosophila persimilis TaxID=7234 RepID=B4GX30_DROPE|nr:GL21073 [Drosophila persimilis]
MELLRWSKTLKLVYYSSLTTFLVEANKQLAGIYDQVVLAQLQNELRGSNDVFKRLKLGDASQKRQLERIPRLGYDALDGMELTQVNALASNMSDSYRNVLHCAYKQPKNGTLRLIPEVQAIFQESRDLDEIEYYWLEWRQRTGLATRDQFVALMKLYKNTAQLNGYPRAEDYWFRSLDQKS